MLKDIRAHHPTIYQEILDRVMTQNDHEDYDDLVFCTKFDYHVNSFDFVHFQIDDHMP